MTRNTGHHAVSNKIPHDEAAQARLNRAHHVAGHATLAMAVGVDVEVLCIVEDRNWFHVHRDGGRFIDQGTMLHIPHRWPANPFEQSKLAETLIRIALAGPCAEMVHRDEPCSVDTIQEDEIDWQLAWKTSKRLLSGDMARVKYQVEEIERTTCFLRHEQYWEAVSHISAALLEHGTFKGKKCKELFERAVLSGASA